MTLEKLGNGDWQVVRLSTNLTYFLEDYFLCRQSGLTKLDCVRLAEDDLVRDAKTFRALVRNGLTEEQTKDFVDELTPQDFTITDTELNSG